MLDENMAEVGGIRSAFNAYQKYVEKNGKEEGLTRHGLGLHLKSNVVHFLCTGRLDLDTFLVVRV